VRIVLEELPRLRQRPVVDLSLEFVPVAFQLVEPARADLVFRFLRQHDELTPVADEPPFERRMVGPSRARLVDRRGECA